MRNLHRSWGTAFVLLLLAVLLTAASPATAKTDGDAIVIWRRGIDTLLADPRDEGLRRAIAMLDARIAELPGELDEKDFPAEGLQLLLGVMRHPMSLRAGLFDADVPMDGPPIYVQLDLQRATEAEAGALLEAITDLLREEAGVRGAPMPDRPGFVRLDLDEAVGYLGARTLGDAHAVTFSVNRMADGAAAPRRAMLPAGAEPLVSGHVDIEALQPLVQMALQEAGPDAALLHAQLEQMGLAGPDTGLVTFALGRTDDRLHAAARWTKYGRVVDAWDARPERPLAGSDLRLVPADATWAQLGAFNPGELRALLRWFEEVAAEARGGADGDPMQQVVDMIGVHPERDVIDHLGGRYATYASETTGGGLIGLVLVVELADPEAMRASIATVAERGNRLGRDMARGYVEFRSLEIEDHSVLSLVFPGLPIPLEPCLAIEGDYLVVGASPRALVAAVDHVASGGPGLGENPRFAEMGGDAIDGALQVSFTDTPALLRSGYPLATLGMSALANMVRSPHGDRREPGPLMPAYRTLAESAKASVTIVRLDGEDLVATAQADRSFVVNGCGALGAIGQSPASFAVAALGAGAVLPAMGKARHQARVVQSMAQLRNLGMAYVVYASENDGSMPSSVRALTDPGYLGLDMFDSPFGPALDGGPDYWLDVSGGKMSEIEFPDRRIIACDRAMHQARGETVVLFADGHVEQVDEWRLMDFLADPANAEIEIEIEIDR